MLPAQGACLEMLGVRGPHPTLPGENASQVSCQVCGNNVESNGIVGKHIVSLRDGIDIMQQCRLCPSPSWPG